MLTGKKLIKDFKKQNKETLSDYLNKIVNNPAVYSDRQKGIKPYMPENAFFFYAVQGTLVMACIDKCTPKDELADEERFHDEDPQYFTEDSHRTSPVWQLSETIKLVKQKLEEFGNPWSVWGVLISESRFFNSDDMQDIWDEMNVTVIDKVDDLDDWNFSILTKEGLDFGKELMDVIRGLKGESEDTLSDAEAEFQKLLQDFLNDNSDKTGEREEEESETPEDDEKEEDDGGDFSTFGPDFFPDATIEQNNNLSVKVQILPPMRNPRAELDKLVGCQVIKKRIDELLALTHYNKMMSKAFPNAKIHEVSLHSIFFGRPGTGKTTVCKIFGSLLHEAGALSKGHVVVADRGTFIGTLWGDEERSVHQVLEKAKGGVLMIDEAYLLNSDNDRDPGRLVIQMLMQVLADEKQRDIAVVLCGYKDQMKKLLDTNPGLHSRFPNCFDFNDFTIDELMEITRRRIAEYQYHFTHQAWHKYKSVLTAAYQVRDPQTWGNARFVANQLERIFIQHAQRCVKEKPTDRQRLLTLTQADITPIEVPRSKPRIGF